MTNKKELAKLLLEEHPGVPREEVSLELVESIMICMRRYLLKQGTLTIDGVGHLEVKTFEGAERKRDARTNQFLKIPPRKVVKFIISENFKKLLNIERPPSEVVE